VNRVAGRAGIVEFGVQLVQVGLEKGRGDHV
jgi:hypothetical protein